MSSPQIQSFLWRSNSSGDKLEDITDGLLQGSVQMDPDNDMTYQFDAIMHYDAWLRLRPYIDWVIPEMRVVWPDGTVRHGRLGLYILIDPATTRGETVAYVHLKAMDPLWLLARQGFGPEDDVLRRIEGGVNKGNRVRDILNTMVVSERAADRVKRAIPTTAHTMRRRHEWESEATKLEVVNELLEGMGCWPLWASKRGVLTSRQNGTTMLRMQHPVRSYTANIPDGYTVANRILPVGNMASEILGIIETSPGFDEFLNTVLVINDDPKLPRIFAESTVTNPQNPRAAMHERHRRHNKRKHNKIIDDSPTAKQIATGILDKLSTYYEVIQLQVVPDPEPEFAREVIDVLAWDALGRPIGDPAFSGRSKYLVHRVTYGMTPDNGTMVIEAGRIDSAEGGLVEVA